MTLHTLSSGSQGNCLLLSDGGTHILVDAGISTRRIKAGLARLGLSMDDLDGILITHEHTDHISGLATLIKHHTVPLYASPGTARQLAYRLAEAEEVLPGVGLLVLERNHDVDRLRSGPYPYSLKQRVLGSQGHLSNEDAAAFAARMATCGTECIVLAHLSKENNTPQLAYDAVDRALRAGGARVRLYVAPRDELSPAYETERTPCRR